MQDNEPKDYPENDAVLDTAIKIMFGFAVLVGAYLGYTAWSQGLYL